jgi:hypothetical protein
MLKDDEKWYLMNITDIDGTPLAEGKIRLDTDSRATDGIKHNNVISVLWKALYAKSDRLEESNNAKV